MADNNVVKLAGAKEEFVAKMGLVDKTMQQALLAQKVQIVDFSMYSARDIEANTTIELMQASDTKRVGVTNVNNRKLGANEYALFVGMQLMSATATVSSGVATDAQIASADYGFIGANIANGEIEIKQGDRILVPRSSCEVFRNGANAVNDTTNHYGFQRTAGLAGYVAFDSPKMMSPLTDIIPTLYLPASTQNSTTHTLVKVVFHGVKTNKA